MQRCCSLDSCEPTRAGGAGLTYTSIAISVRLCNGMLSLTTPLSQILCDIDCFHLQSYWRLARDRLIPRHLWIVNAYAAPSPWFQVGLFSTWVFNQWMMAALINGSAMELSGGVRWWKCSSEYHNMIRVINIVWCDREANGAHPTCGMQIRCFWWMPLLL